MPLGTSIGTTNSVMFGVALEALRDRDMRFTLPPRPPRLLHHDLDAPPWWNVRKKSRLYYQGLVRKQPRPLMQFVLVPENGPDRLRDWEPDFAKILAWIETLEPPRYPGPIDEPLAARGRTVFERHCAKCHGTYGTEEEYPELVVPLEVVGTDPVRQQALPDEYHRKFQESWLAEYEGYKPPAVRGYVAPPLDGIWASAPYLHNGSVPTLWHLLHPQQRPRAWKRTEDGYDHRRVGLEVQASKSVPEGLTPAERRTWFDTAHRGKSASGHDFPEKVPLEERPSLLEYLKTL
jgi:mono/diheme cytochrome c family protein